MNGPQDRLPQRTYPIALVAIGCAAVLCFFWTRLFLTLPPPWPDEALFADVARNLARTGVMGSELYREAIPSLAHHYYLTPPLYPLVLAPLFRIGAEGLLPLRLVSAGLGLAALALTWGVARRAGLGRLAALCATALTASSIPFFRCAHVARMDVLALALVLLTVWLGMAPGRGGAGGSRPRAAALAIGFVAGLAFLAHPLGFVALPIGMIAAATAPGSGARGGALSASRGSRETTLPIALALLGFALALLPWALYVSRDPAGFAEQFGNQLSRKATGVSAGILLRVFLDQWAVPRALTAGIVLAGLAGLAMLGRDRRSARLLWPAQLLLVVAVIAGGEEWYAAYVLPLTCVGLVRVVALAERRPLWKNLVGAAGATLAGVLLACSAAFLVSLSARAASEGAGYAAWCRDIEREVPPGKTLLLACVPAPDFRLTPGRNPLRYLPPGGFRLEPRVEEEVVSAADYVVVGGDVLDPRWIRRIDSRAASSVVVQDGRRHARVFRMDRDETAGVSGRLSNDLPGGGRR